MLALGSLIGSALTHAGLAIWYDDRPAIVVRDIVVKSNKLRSGEPFEYSFSYDKRPECHPPLGRSEEQYRLYTMKDGEIAHWHWLSYARSSQTAPGRNMKLPGYYRIPMPPLDPGLYALQWVAEYQCARASAEQTIEGPLLKFHVY